MTLAPSPGLFSGNGTTTQINNLLDHAQTEAQSGNHRIGGSNLTKRVEDLSSLPGRHFNILVPEGKTQAAGS